MRRIVAVCLLSLVTLVFVFSTPAPSHAESVPKLEESFGTANDLVRSRMKVASTDSAGKTAAALMTPEQLAALVDSLPARAVYSDAKPVLAINIVFLGSEAHVRDALRGAGWYEVARSWGRSLLEGASDLASGGKIERFPPLREFYVEGKAQHFNWTQSVDTIESRHHFRLWRAMKNDSLGREIWPGAADFDVRIDWKRLVHEPDPHIDEERDYIAATLRERPLVARVSLVATEKIPHEAHEGYANFFSDGRVLVVELIAEDSR